MTGARIFDGRDEKFFLLVPTGLLIACFVLRNLGLSYSTDPDQQTLVLFVTTFFGLTAAHNAFTYVLLCLPEFRQWRLAQEKSPIGKWSAVFVGALLIFFLAGASRVLKSEWAWTFNIVAFFLLWFVNAWHTFRQHFGFSMLYNKNWLIRTQATPEEKQRVTQTEKLERFFYTGASLSGAIGLAIRFSAPEQGALFYTAFLGTSLLFCVGTLYANFQYPKSLRRVKVLYNLRIFLVPLAFYDLIIAAAVAINHNFEYWFVFKRTVKKSVAPWKTRLYFFGSLWIFAVMAASLLRKQGGLPMITHYFESYPWASVLILSFSWAVTSAHYYLDGKIFRFSDDSTRKHIAPFFIAEA